MERNQAKRARRHSFSSLEESAKEMEAKFAAIASKEREGLKRSSSPSVSEGSSPKRQATGTRAAASSGADAGVNAGRMGDFVCLPQGKVRAISAVTRSRRKCMLRSAAPYARSDRARARVKTLPSTISPQIRLNGRCSRSSSGWTGLRWSLV